MLLNEFNLLIYNEMGTEMPAQQRWIDNQADLHNIFTEVNRHVSPIPDAPFVNFNQKNVVFLHFGTFSYGGIQMELKNVEFNHPVLNITLSKQSPSAMQPALTVITHPYMFIEIDKLNSQPKEIKLTYE